MERKTFKAQINASKEKVWDVLWSDETYGEWTVPFTEGSYAESNWEEGSSIRFLTPKGDGMYSIIDKKESPNIMAFKHLGEIVQGKKVAKAWAGAMETYTLKEKNGTTELEVAVDVAMEYEDYFNDTFPKALKIVKSLAEGV